MGLAATGPRNPNITLLWRDEIPDTVFGTTRILR